MIVSPHGPYENEGLRGEGLRRRRRGVRDWGTVPHPWKDLRARYPPRLPPGGRGAEAVRGAADPPEDVSEHPLGPAEGPRGRGALVPHAVQRDPAPSGLRRDREDVRPPARVRQPPGLGRETRPPCGARPSEGGGNRP